MSPIRSALSSIVAQPAGVAAADPATPAGPGFGAALDALSATATGNDKTALPVVAAPGLASVKTATALNAPPEPLGQFADLVAQRAAAAVLPTPASPAPRLPAKPAADDTKSTKTVDPAALPDLPPVTLAVTPLLPLPVLPVTTPALPSPALGSAIPATAHAPTGVQSATAALQPAPLAPAASLMELATETGAGDGSPNAASVAAATVSGTATAAVPQAVSNDAGAPMMPAPIVPSAAAAVPTALAPAMATALAPATPPAPPAGSKPANAPIGTGGMRVTSVQQTILRAAPDSPPAEPAAALDPVSVDPAAIIPAAAPSVPQPTDAASMAFTALPVEEEKKPSNGTATDAGSLAANPLETRQAADVAAPAAAAKAVNHPAPAEQIAPALAALATGRSDAGHRLSITLAPEQLGSVGITIERVADGSTTIHVTAERLETLHMLQQDQADLTRSLDQAGVAPEHRTLSFSWSGEGGQSAWSGQGQGQGQSQSQGNAYTPNHRAYVAAYNDEQPVLAARRSLDAGSVDITA